MAYFNSLGSARFHAAPPRTVSSSLSSSNAFYSRPRTVSLLGTFHLCMNIRGPPERGKVREKGHARENGRFPFRLVLPRSPPSGNSEAPWFKSTIKPRSLNIYEPGSHNMSARAAHRQAATLRGCPAITPDTHVQSFRPCSESELKITRRWSLWWDSRRWRCAPGYPFLSPRRQRFFLSLFFYLFFNRYPRQTSCGGIERGIFARISYTQMYKPKYKHASWVSKNL